MQFSNVLLSLASMALTIAAPTANESAVPAVGAWRETFTKTADTQTYCKFKGGMYSFVSFGEFVPFDHIAN